MDLTNSFAIAIVGPTGAGKSALAVFLAQALDGEILNVDSVQVYAGLNIGAAKMPLDQRGGIPHHLLDVFAPIEECTAGRFVAEASAALRSIAARRRTAILVGGTGFYLRSLLQGLSPAPAKNAELRARLHPLAVRRPKALHRFLRRVDRSAAERIHENDHQKLIRAIELAASQDNSAPRQPLEGFRVMKIGLNPDRAALYQRLNQRSEQMFRAGLLDEVRALLDSGLPKNARALQSLGYKQALSWMDGELSLPEAIVELQTKTRQYAKRQMTWFRREDDVFWLEGFGDTEQIQTAARRLVQNQSDQ